MLETQKSIAKSEQSFSRGAQPRFTLDLSKSGSADSASLWYFTCLTHPITLEHLYLSTVRVLRLYGLTWGGGGPAAQVLATVSQGAEEDPSGLSQCHLRAAQPTGPTVQANSHHRCLCSWP